MVSVAGKKVRIRTLHTGDLQDFLAYRSDPDAYRWQGFGELDETSARQFLRKHISLDFGTTGQWQQLGIELLPEKRLVGDCAIRFSMHEPRHAELGMTIAPKFHRQGIGKEALILLLNLLFSRGKLHKVIAMVDEKNTPSIGLLEALTFVREGRLRQHFWNKMEEKWDDELLYGLLAEEWIYSPWWESAATQ